MLIERLSLVVAADTLRENIDWKSAFPLQQSQFGPTFQVEGSSPPTIFLVKN